MLEFQTLQPYQNYLTEIKEAKVYYIFDHLSFADGKQDALKNALEKNQINFKNKLFIFDSYQYLDGYQDCGIYTNEFFLFTINSYQRAFPNYEINFAAKRILFNCQMNKSRYPRALASCWLKNNLYQTVEFIYSQPWDQSNLIPFLSSTIEKQKFNLNTDVLPKIWFDYNGNDSLNYLDNTSNEEIFKNCLKHQMFDPCVFSIVLEPIENELGTTLTEKYVNAVYGGNIPIVYGYNVYDVLEKLGFDTFADVINTSSQYIVDPYERIIHMLDSNKDLLSNGFDLINDSNIQKRLIQNLALLRDQKKLNSNLINLNSPKMLQIYKDLTAKDKKLWELSSNFNSILDNFKC